MLCSFNSYVFTDGRWNDNACGIDNAFICKRPYDNTAPITSEPTVPPEGGCPSDWYKLLNKCYSLNGYMEQDRLNWFDARDSCREKGNGQGNLATLHNKQQQGRRGLGLFYEDLMQIAKTFGCIKFSNCSDLNENGLKLFSVIWQVIKRIV